MTANFPFHGDLRARLNRNGNRPSNQRHFAPNQSHNNYQNNNHFNNHQQRNQSWPSDEDPNNPFAYQWRNDAFDPQLPQQYENITMRFRNDRVRSSFEEMNFHALNPMVGNQPGMQQGSMSVHVPNEDHYQSGPDQMFSRRPYRPPQPQQHPHQLNHSTTTNIIDYHHQNSRSSQTKPRSRDYRASRDPRIQKLLVPVKTEETLPCEQPGIKSETRCAHPRPKLFVKQENVVASNILRTQVPPSSTRMNPMLADRIEHAKYDKAKLDKLRNPNRGERAVDCIQPVPRPTKDLELDCEINRVIEKLNVPVITTPANFSNYKIPRMNGANADASDTDSDPKDVSKTKEKPPNSSKETPLNSPAPAAQIIPKEKPLISPAPAVHNTPKDKTIVIKPATTKTTSEKIPVDVQCGSANKPFVSRIVKSNRDSQSATPRESSDSSDVEVSKVRRFRKILPSADSEDDESENSQSQPKSLSCSSTVVELKKNVPKEVHRSRSRSRRSSEETSRKGKSVTPSCKVGSSREESKDPLRRDRPKQTKDSDKSKSRATTSSEDSVEEDWGVKKRSSANPKSTALKTTKGTKKRPRVDLEKNSGGENNDSPGSPINIQCDSTAKQSKKRKEDQKSDIEDSVVAKPKGKLKVKNRSRSRIEDSAATIVSEASLNDNNDKSASNTNDEAKKVQMSPQSHVPIISSSDTPAKTGNDIDKIIESIRQLDGDMLEKVKSVLLGKSQESPSSSSQDATIQPRARLSALDPLSLINLSPRVIISKHTIPLTIDVPPTQSPTISSCERVDALQSPFPANLVAIQTSETPSTAIPINTALRAGAFSPVPDRNSPKIRRKRTNELEKLQEDIASNYLLKELHTSTSRAVTKPQDMPKKIANRRKSMCSSLCNENGGIKLKITREPPTKLRRRMSIGHAVARLSPIENEIFNDDEHYDLDSGNCRLCTSSSDDMVRHYLDCHSESEVFCCRLNYNTAIRLKRGEQLNVFVNSESAEFLCLLCKQTVSCATYYDVYEHLVGHTGEFYFKCNDCSFRDYTQNNQHADFHKFEICPYTEFEDNKLVAFMCGKCHFVQLNKANVDKHIVCHHRNESARISSMKIVLLDFGKSKIAALDFEELDGRFKVLPLIERDEVASNEFQELYEGYLTQDPVSESEEEDFAYSSFELDVKNLMKMQPPPAEDTKIQSRITIGDLSYDFTTGLFEFTNHRGKFVNYYEKVKKYLTDISFLGDEWNGNCFECDKYNKYSESVPVHMELAHLRNVHWHKTAPEARKETLAVAEVSKPVDEFLRPWLQKKCAKSEADCKKMLSLSSILSMYKCMAANCTFYTQRLESMHKHLEQHEADPCADEDALIECCYCEDEFASPSDYLAHVGTKHNSSQFYCPYCFYRSHYETTLLHVQMYHPDRQPFLFDGMLSPFYSKKYPDNHEILASLTTNVFIQNCLDCNAKYYPLDLFAAHLETHGPTYTCDVCQKTISVINFLPHLATHDRGPFECIYCPFGALDGTSIKNHLMNHHGTETFYVCVRFIREGNPPDDLESIRVCNMAESDRNAIVKTVPKEIFEELEVKDRSIVISNVQGGLEEEEMFGSNSDTERFISSLPTASLFDRRIKCPTCNYCSSVRMNLIRHVQSNAGNCVGNQENDPVNHVSTIARIPIKKRILLDQNLAIGMPVKKRRMTISEMTSPDEVEPLYVPASQRFVCGVGNCSHIGLGEERMLSLHMNGAHADANSFICPHCHKSLSGTDFDIDVIIAHYRLHDKQLFQCGTCCFYADTRHNVSKHIRKRHTSTVNEEDIVVIRQGAVSQISPSTAKPAMKILMRRHSMAAPKTPAIEWYKCSYCAFECGGLDDMSTHSVEVHKHTGQFGCSDCSGTLKKATGFTMHVRFKHPRSNPKMITHFSLASKDTFSFDPQPTPNVIAPFQSIPKVITPPKAALKVMAPPKPAPKVVAPPKPAPKVVAPPKPNSKVVAPPRPTSGVMALPKSTPKVAAPIKPAKPSPVVAVVAENSSDSRSVLKANFEDKPIHRPLQYFCEQCPQTFNDWNPIYEHCQHSHDVVFNPKLPPFLIYACYFCSFNTPRVATLAKHFSDDHDNMTPLYNLEYMVKCMMCEYANTVEKVTQHYAESHKDERPLLRNILQETCGLCSFQYKDEANFRTHFDKAHKKIANQTLKMNDKLMKRLLNVKVDKVFKCRRCKLVMKKYQCRFHEHEKDCVPVEVAHRYLCGICKFVTLDYELAKKHMNRHQSKSVECNRCKEKFANFDTLLQHIPKSHRQVGDYMSELMKLYSMEIIFPNGLVTSESMAMKALKACHFKCREVSGKEV